MIPLSSWKPPWPVLLLSLLLIWAPLPFASVTPPGLALLRIGSFVALAAALLTSSRREGRPSLRLPEVSLLALATIGLLQSVPLPAEVVGLISPERVELGAVSGGGSGWLPLSLAPSQSLSTALTLVAVAAALTAAGLVGSDRLSRRWLFGSILAAALFQLLYGFRHVAASSTAVWGREVARDPSRLRGTFVNPAHLAPYLEMALALVFALVWWLLLKSRREEWRVESALMTTGGLALLWLLLFAGLAFTRSRAALAAALLATLVQGVVLAAYHRRWRLLPVGLGAAIAGIVLIAWVGLEQGLGRVLGTSVYSLAASARVEVWKETLGLWRRFPISGTGLGSFESAFPMVETPELAVVTWQHAHNDWVELLATGGLLAGVAVMVGLIALVARLRSNLLCSRSQEAAAAALAGVGAVVAVGFHEFLDFGLTQPANAFTLAVLVGVAAAGDRRSRPDSRPGS